jgi:hypothetical protein
VKRVAWAVYRADVSPGSRLGVQKVTPRYLGRVMAAHYARALELAWKRWPEEKDESQVQLGFSVRKEVGE